MAAGQEATPGSSDTDLALQITGISVIAAVAVILVALPVLGGLTSHLGGELSFSKIKRRRGRGLAPTLVGDRVGVGP